VASVAKGLCEICGGFKHQDFSAGLYYHVISLTANKRAHRSSFEFFYWP
jgi:hypothetical protein